MYKGEIYPAPKVEVVDVCGAGDTFLASLTYFYLLDSDIESAIKKAILASSITVQHTGVYAPSLDEICD
jgi:sugar/nucleoside kinase (ribokinase family)